MRIHLTLKPEHLAPVNAAAGPGSTFSSPLIQLGGDLVIIELQGELSHEGDKSGGVIGVLGLDRPDKPTLHLGPHHLLHGKISTLPKPLAVIRRATVEDAEGEGEGVVEGDAEAENEAEYEDLDDVGKNQEGGNSIKRRKTDDQDAASSFQSDPQCALFKTPERATSTTNRQKANRKEKENEAGPSSSPISSTFYPSSAMKDYSSELDFSSPGLSHLESEVDSPDIRTRRHDDDDDEDDAVDWGVNGRANVQKKRKKEKKKRTRRYEVVGVVKKKVVFALRPEPIVTATILPD